jgi:GNAT superfamily N-acetyltransferase
MTGSARREDPGPVALHRTVDPQEFLAACAGALAADPVEFNLPATVAHSEASRGVHGSTYLWLEDAGTVRAVCLCYPGEPVSLSGAGAGEAEAFVDALLDDPVVDTEEDRARPPVSDDRGPVGSGSLARGVRGPVDGARAFARRWQERTGQGIDREMAQGVYVCDRLDPPSGVPGSPRQAVPDDVSTAFDRFVAFAAEVGVGPPRRQAVESVVTGGRLWWWEDRDRSPDPVAMGAVTPAPVGVARVGAVHTPPEHRRHGYASALTAHLTARVLAAGHRVMLYTDLDNPTSNGIYAAIGYRRVGDSLALWFDRPAEQGPAGP